MILLACHKEEAGINNQSTKTDSIQAWKSNPYFFREGKILLNGHISGDCLTIAGVKAISTFDTSSSMEPLVNIAVDGFSALDYRPAMSDHFEVYKGEHSSELYINTNWYPSLELLHVNLDLATVDSIHFSADDMIEPEYYTHPIGVFNNQNQLLVPVHKNDVAAGLVMSLTNIQMTNTEKIKFTDTVEAFQSTLTYDLKPIYFDVDQFQYVRGLFSFDENFFVSIDDGFWKIKPNSDKVKAFFSGGNSHDVVRKMIRYKDHFLAFTDYEGNIYQSDLSGEVWNKVGSNFHPYFDEMDFFQVGDTLCFYAYSQLYTLNLDNETIKELDNTGLEGNAITSVNQFNGKVWVTTLSGLFTRDEKDFFTYKKTDSNQQ